MNSETESLKEENENLRAILEEQAKGDTQCFLNDLPESHPLASEKNFERMTGVEEIPEKYKEVFAAILATSTQWMYVKNPAEELEWEKSARHQIQVWKWYHPGAHFTKFDECQVLMFFRRYLNRGYGGFERNGINTVIHTMNYQTTPIAPQAAAGAVKKLSIFDRLNPFKK